MGENAVCGLLGSGEESLILTESGRFPIPKADSTQLSNASNYTEVYDATRLDQFTYLSKMKVEGIN